MDRRAGGGGGGGDGEGRRGVSLIAGLPAVRHGAVRMGVVEPRRLGGALRACLAARAPAGRSAVRGPGPRSLG